MCGTSFFLLEALITQRERDDRGNLLLGLSMLLEYILGLKIIE